MSGSGTPNLSIVDSLTQFVSATQADWNTITVPVPSGMVIYANDTTVLKMGDGVTLYSALPVLLTLNQITSLIASITSIGVATTANTAAITTLQTTVTALSGEISAPVAPVDITAGGTTTLTSVQKYVAVNNTTGSAIIVELPAAPGLNELHSIKDVAGTAQANPITLNGNGHLIDGDATMVIETAFGAASVWWNGTSWSQL